MKLMLCVGVFWLSVVAALGQERNAKYDAILKQLDEQRQLEIKAVRQRIARYRDSLNKPGAVRSQSAKQVQEYLDRLRSGKELFAFDLTPESKPETVGRVRLVAEAQEVTGPKRMLLWNRGSQIVPQVRLPQESRTLTSGGSPRSQADRFGGTLFEVDGIVTTGIKRAENVTLNHLVQLLAVEERQVGEGSMKMYVLEVINEQSLLDYKSKRR